MALGDLLEEFPLPWHDARVQAVKDACASTFYKPREIEQVWVAAGLGPQHLSWESSADTIWFAGFNYAAGQRKLGDLIEVAATRSPAFADRLRELDQDDPPLPAKAAEMVDPGEFHNFPDTLDQERQIVAGVPTLRDINFLALGLERGRAVCRIDANFGAFTQDGTGFRIGPDLVLTNHHVVYDEENANTPSGAVQLIFRHELGVDGQMRTDKVVVNVDVANMRGDESNDFAVLPVVGTLPDEIPILSIAGPSEPIEVDDRVCIIQHPKGLPKKIGLYHNIVRHADDTVLQYWTDTDVGSSGSPVFNENWEVVALHHAAVKKDGDLHGYANQGRTIERINALVFPHAGGR